MLEDFLEYTRILLYLFGAYALLILAVDNKALRLILVSNAFYFLVWMSLIFVQFENPQEYRYIANIVSTPALFLFVILIFFNLWVIRKD